MKEYNVSTDLVIEAFSFSASIKKVKTVAGSLSVLRTWYLDGVRTKEDLEQHLKIGIKGTLLTAKSYPFLVSTDFLQKQRKSSWILGLTI